MDKTEESGRSLPNAEELGNDFLKDIQKLMEVARPVVKKWSPYIKMIEDGVSPELKSKIENELKDIMDELSK